MEKRTPSIINDLTIPFVRNVMGPVSYTIVRLNKSPGSHAYQLAMSIVYEAGLMIYAEHGHTLLDWPGRELIKEVPSTWDEIKFLAGMPGDHVIIARRKGQDWFVGGMTGPARTVHIPLIFLTADIDYNALIFRDQSHTAMLRETTTINRNTILSFDILENGGFALHLSPIPSHP